MCMLPTWGCGGVSEMRKELAARDSHEECVCNQGWHEGGLSLCVL